MTQPTPADIRLALRAAGFSPVACIGKVPVLAEWQNRRDATLGEIARWPGGNSGIDTKDTPGCDIDVDDAEPAADVEAAARDWFDGRGTIPVRFGRAPRRALLFRTAAPFPKIVVKFVAPNGSKHKIEFLGDGQQIIVAGIHPDTGAHYAWHADLCPWNMTRADLVEIDEGEAHAFLDYVAAMLKEKYGFERGSDSNGHDSHSPFETVARSAVSNVATEPIEALAALDPADGEQVNATYCRVIPELLQQGEHPDDVLKQVVDAAMAAAERAGLAWSRAEEIKRVVATILSQYRNMSILLRDYDPATGAIPSCLPGEFHEAWLRVLATGGRPMMHFNRAGFCIKGMQRIFPSNTSHTAKLGNAPSHAKSENANAEAGAGNSPRTFRFRLMSFADLRPGPEPLYLVDELIPVAGLVDVWGKAKCYKSFWCLDLMLHVAMGWEYRDRYVRQGAVVYCAFEGAHGYKKRVEALRRHYAIAPDAYVPLYVMPGQANLIKEHKVLVADIKAQLGDQRPAAVVLDTLNKSLHGSENKDIDMGEYIRAAEAIRDAFECVVVIVHHCGYDDTRPRGHSSLPGAVDAQLSVSRTDATVTVTVEMMRDGPEDTVVTSTAQSIEVGHDQNGKILTSLVLVPGVTQEYATERRKWSRPLAVFYASLKDALAAHGLAFQYEVGVLPTRAVDLKAVRERFYSNYAEAEEDEAKGKAALRQAFGRGLGEAQKKEIVRSQRTATGSTMVWLPDREPA